MYLPMHLKNEQSTVGYYEASNASTSCRPSNMNPTDPLPPPQPSLLCLRLKNDPQATGLARTLALLMPEKGKDLPDTDKFVCNFCFGNPNEFPSADLVNAFKAGCDPKTPDHYGYRRSMPQFTTFLQERLPERYGMQGMGLEANDIFLTTGNFANILLALQLVVNSFDEVICPEPGWFSYRRLIHTVRGIPRPVKVSTGESGSHQRDMDDIIAAIPPIPAQ